MLRQGGWAVPISCEHPLVQIWLQHVGALQKAWCWLTTGDAGMAQCRATSSQEQCTTFWTPFTLVAVLALASLSWISLCAWLIRKAIRKWYTGSLHIEVAKEAAHQARNLHVKQAKQLNMPGTPHQWCKLARTAQHPVLCAVCFNEVAPDLGVKVGCCEVCGIAVHNLCRHLMPSNCKPPALNGGMMLHHWLPAACVVESEHSTDDISVDAGLTSLCMYCKEPCVGMLLPVEEPIWQCSWCQQVCHVSCHSREHKVLASPKPKVGKKKGKKKIGQHPQSMVNLGKHDNQDDAGGIGRGKPTSTRLTTILDCPEGLAVGEDGVDPVLAAMRIASVSAGSPEDPHRSQHLHDKGSQTGRSSSAVTANACGIIRQGSRDDTLLGRHSGSWVSGMGPARPSGNGHIVLPAGSSSPQHSTIPGCDSMHQTQRMDLCRLGPVARMVVPPTCVVSMERGGYEAPPASPGPAGTESETSSPHSASMSGGINRMILPFDKDALATDVFERTTSWTSRAMKAGKAAGRQARQQAKEVLEGLYRSGTRAPAVKSTEYKIAGLSAWHRPLLVFINTKSGPQVGHGLRRWFLRMFNPIQVVELPRQDPMAALRLFSSVGGLRVLVVGGDGTVGWILGCIDRMQKEKEEEALQAAEANMDESIAPSPWTPPPVAVLPLGTGNDLARCLNWGGGLNAVRESGITALMNEIQRAAVVLLDRWNVQITPLEEGDDKADPPHVEKSMNNYLGIGVDAKAALDFHNTRERYPKWFQSQLGNKMWYGVVGAPDLLGHSCAVLPDIMHMEVDGVHVPLPDDIEGLMLLNITSYMGGVNLWTCGQPQDSQKHQMDYSSNRSVPSTHSYGVQSMCDGMIEVVAVYGTWHLGQLQVGMSKAQRVAQGRSIRLRMKGTLPMQVDGEPWMQGPAQLDIRCQGKAFMLRRLNSSSAGMMASIVGEALDTCEGKGILTSAQRQAIIAELAARLGPIL